VTNSPFAIVCVFTQRWEPDLGVLNRSRPSASRRVSPELALLHDFNAAKQERYTVGFIASHVTVEPDGSTAGRMTRLLV
jgi:hypothetical protein